MHLFHGSVMFLPFSPIRFSIMHPLLAIKKKQIKFINLPNKSKIPIVCSFAQCCLQNLGTISLYYNSTKLTNMSKYSKNRIKNQHSAQGELMYMKPKDLIFYQP